MVEVKDKSGTVGGSNEDISPEELVHFESVETPRDWKEERNRKASNIDRNLDEKVYEKDKDKNTDKQRCNERNRDADKDRDVYESKDRDKDEQKSPRKKSFHDDHKSPASNSRSGPARVDKDGGARRERPREREERDYEVSREPRRSRERSRERERRRSGERVEKNVGSHNNEFDRSRSSPYSVGDRGSYRREHDSHRREHESHKRDHNPSGMDNDSHRRENDSHRRDSDSHRRDSDSHRRDSDSHRRDSDSHRRENDSHRRDHEPQRRDHDPSRREHQPYGGERSRNPSNSHSRRSPPRERRYSSRTEEEFRRESSLRGRPRSPHFRSRPTEDHSPRPVSPRRHSFSYRDAPLRSPLYTRDMSSPRKRSPVGRVPEREVHSRIQSDRPSQDFPSERTYIRGAAPRDDALYESKRRYSPEAEYPRLEYKHDPRDDSLTPSRPKNTGRSVFDRISSAPREVTISNKYLTPVGTDNRKRGRGGGASSRANRVNQNYPDNTVSTLRDLSDRPLKRDREEPPPALTEPPTSWVEEKRARLRSRVEPEDILDMELIILSEKQREYSEKVEQRIRHMGVTTSLITLPPSRGVAETLDSAVRRNLLYAIIILPQHEQHNSITLTILHGRNPQEHKNMPLEDSLCLINLDHKKYEEAIKDGLIQPRGTHETDKNTSPDSTPDKPKLDLEQLSEIVRKFPQTKDSISESDRNSQDLQAKILGLLGSSAIIPSKTDAPISPDQNISQFPILPDPSLTMPGFQSPLGPFSPIPGCQPHRMFPPPALLPGFPHPAFNFPPGSIHFPPGNPYLPHPSMLGHPPLHISGGFPPRP